MTPHAAHRPATDAGRCVRRGPAMTTDDLRRLAGAHEGTSHEEACR